jgi:hypothetical protein
VERRLELEHLPAQANLRAADLVEGPIEVSRELLIDPGRVQRFCSLVQGVLSPKSDELRPREAGRLRSRVIRDRIYHAELGVTQPRISDLVRGKIDRFSVDSLIEMLGRTGARISVVVKPRRRVA